LIGIVLKEGIKVWGVGCRVWGVGRINKNNLGSSLLGMVRSGGINRLNPYLARDLID
jgi:hypothetical protein